METSMNRILLTDLMPPHFCAYLKPVLGFPTSYVMVFYMFNDLRWQVMVRYCWLLVELLTITV